MERHSNPRGIAIVTVTVLSIPLALIAYALSCGISNETGITTEQRSVIPTRTPQQHANHQATMQAGRMAATRTAGITQASRPAPTPISAAPSGYSQADLDIAAICYAFAQTYLDGGSYDWMFYAYYEDMERSINTRQGSDIVDAMIALSDEMDKPSPSANSVRRLTHQVLALCELIDDDGGRERFHMAATPTIIPVIQQNSGEGFTSSSRAPRPSAPRPSAPTVTVPRPSDYIKPTR